MSLLKGGLLILDTCYQRWILMHVEQTRINMQSQGQSHQLPSAAHILLDQNPNSTGSNLVVKQNDIQSLSSVGKK